MKRTVVETLCGWAVFRGPAAPQFYEGSFPTEQEARRVAVARENDEFYEALSFLAKAVTRRSAPNQREMYAIVVDPADAVKQ